MTGTLYTADHRMFQLPPLLSWRVTHTGTVPCDSFSVTFVYCKEMAEALRLAAGFVAEEGGMVMLRAVVDEYTVDLNSGGLTATVSGRGYAARLLDNESRPVTYQQAALTEILRNHAEPYGVACGEMAEVRADSVYTVAAGSQPVEGGGELLPDLWGLCPPVQPGGNAAGGTGEGGADPLDWGGGAFLYAAGRPLRGADGGTGD